MKRQRHRYEKPTILVLVLSYTSSVISVPSVAKKH
jgi:hypothetical protein